MTRLELRRVRGRHVRRLDLSLEAGVHVVTGGPELEVAELVSLAAGVTRPAKGSLRLNGVRPFHDGAVRRRTGALLAVEWPLEARTVEDAVSRALATSETKASAAAVFAPPWLTALLPRACASLSPVERRKIALALALGLQDPWLLALHEPLGLGLAFPDLVATLSLRAAAGAVVLLALSRREDAVALRALGAPEGVSFELDRASPSGIRTWSSSPATVAGGGEGGAPPAATGARIGGGDLSVRNERDAVRP